MRKIAHSFLGSVRMLLTTFWMLGQAALLAQDSQVLPFQAAKQRADAGDAFAQAVVATHYSLGWQTEKNQEMAVRYATASARAGHPLGYFRLGALLRVGEGIPKDNELGLKYQAAVFDELRRLKDPYSITAAGIMIFQGNVVRQKAAVEERHREAAQLYKIAADMGYAPAQFNYSMCNEMGHGIPKDAATSMQYLKLSADAGYPLAVRHVDELAMTAQTSGQTDTLDRIAGKNDQGDEWAYEFIDSHESNPKAPVLWRLDNERLLFSNEEWIVTGSFIYLGLGRGKCHLSVWDARSLHLACSLSVPNNVLHLDWSPARRQFLAVTTCGSDDMRWIKFPDDVAQALVVIDLQKRQIERTALWQPQNPSFDYARHCAPRWQGDEIVVPHTPGPNEMIPAAGIAWNRPAFTDVRVRFSRAKGSNSSGLSSKAPDRAGLNHVGLNTKTATLQTPYPDAASQLQASAGRVTAGIDRGVNVVRPSPQGGILSVNLSALRNRLVRTEETKWESVGIFADGVLRGVSQNHLVLASAAGVCRVALAKSGKDRPNVQIDFTDSAAFIGRLAPGARPGIQITKVDPSGQMTPETVSLSSEIKAVDLSDGSDFALNGARRSIAMVLGNFDQGRFWKEFDWAGGKPISPPVEDNTGKGMFAYDHVHGSASSGLTLTSTLTDSSTGGRAQTVTLTDLRTGKNFRIEEGPQRGVQPLVARLDPGNTAVVLSSGYVAAQVERVDLNSGAVTPLIQWTWDDKDGRAFFESSKNWLFVPQPDGYQIIELFADREAFRKIADLYFHGEDQYSVVLPDGFYAGSPGCDELLKLKAGTSWMFAKGLAPWRNRPAEVLKRLGGDQGQIDVLAKVTQRWLDRIGFDASKAEPQVRDLPKVVVPERPPLWAKANEVILPVEVTAGNQALEEVSLQINGVSVARMRGDGWAAPPGGTSKGSIPLVLSEGQNWIEVNAVDAQGRSSEIQRFRTILKPGTRKHQRFVVCIGVSEYARPELNLEFAAKDAQDMMSTLKATGLSGSTKTLLLTNKEAGRAAVEKVRSFIAQSSESDEVILFCAGHGVLDEKLDYVFASHDFDPAKPAQTGIMLNDLLEAVSSGKARMRLVLLDTCHAGLVGEREEMLLAQTNSKLPASVRSIKLRGDALTNHSGVSAQDQQRFIEEMFLLPGLKSGVSVIGASGGAQFALESDLLHNGVFTASVIEALRDRKADWNHDGEISVSELKSFVSQRVPELTGNAQRPSVVTFERDQDFVLRK